MSGIEIAGLVLSSIPLLISALEHYSQGVSTIKRMIKYKWELDQLVIVLQAEYNIYLNTCERLLDGLVPDTAVEELVNEPSSELWKNRVLNEKLEQRLDRSFVGYMKLLKNVNETIEEFKRRLDLDVNGQVKWVDHKMIKQAFRWGKFSLSKESYNDLLKRLREGNRALSELTQHSTKFGLSKRKSRQSLEIDIIRKYAKSVYEALRSSFGCTCTESHSVMLGLSVQPDNIDAYNGGSNPQKPQFRIVISGLARKKDEKIDTALIWQETRIQPEEEEYQIHTSNKIKDVECHDIKTIQEEKPTTNDKDSKVKYGVPFMKTRKKVRFAGPSDSALSSLVSTSARTSLAYIHPVTVGIKLTSPTIEANSILLKTASELERSKFLQNICPLGVSMPKLKQSNCLGYIHGNNTKFLVYDLSRSDEIDSSWTIISLSQILRKSITSPPRLTPSDKLQLSAIVASAVLQLYQSPWLEVTWDSEDILFLQRRGQRLHQQVCVARKLPEAESLDSDVRKHTIGFIRSPVLFALSIILVEISLGEPLERWRTADDVEEARGSNGPLADLVTVTRLLSDDTVLMEVGGPCRDAIQRCMELSFDSRGANAGLAESRFCQEVYDNVVVALEEEAKKFRI